MYLIFIYLPWFWNPWENGLWDSEQFLPDESLEVLGQIMPNHFCCWTPVRWKNLLVLFSILPKTSPCNENKIIIPIKSYWSLGLLLSFRRTIVRYYYLLPCDGNSNFQLKIVKLRFLSIPILDSVKGTILNCIWPSILQIWLFKMRPNFWRVNTMSIHKI